MGLELTKDQRYTAYIILLAELEELEPKGDGDKTRICHLIYRFLGITNRGFDEKWTNSEWFWQTAVCCSINAVLEFFPELKNKEPVLRGWPKTDKWGTEQRKKWLMECIKETSDYDKGTIPDNQEQNRDTHGSVVGVLQRKRRNAVYS